MAKKKTKKGRLKKRERFDLSDPETVAVLAKRIKFAYRKVCGSASPEDIEDMILEVLTRWMEGKNQHSTVDQTIIDVLRQVNNSGRKTSRGRPILEVYELRKALSRAIPYGDLDIDRFKSVKKATPKYEHLDFERLINLLPKKNEVDLIRQKAVLKLYYRWGLTYGEIGDLFDVSESRVAQIIYDCRMLLKKQLKKGEKRK